MRQTLYGKSIDYSGSFVRLGSAVFHARLSNGALHFMAS